MVQKLLEFEGLQIDGVRIPAFKLGTPEFLRLEFSQLDVYKNFLEVLEKVLAKTSVVSVYNWGKRNSSKNVFFSFRVGEYLEKYTDMSSREISDFMKSTTYSPMSRIGDLTIPIQNLIFLRASIVANRYLMVATGGMGIRELTSVYNMVNVLLEKDGTCLDITYPYLIDENLDSILLKSPRIIRI